MKNFLRQILPAFKPATPLEWGPWAYNSYGLGKVGKTSWGRELGF